MSEKQTINDLLMEVAKFRKDNDYLMGELGYWKQQAQQIDSVSRGCDTDTREKLEEDVQHFANYWSYDDYLSDETVEEMRVECMNELRELLDRQAAITRIEVENEHADENLALNRHRGELQAKVDELTCELEDEKQEYKWLFDFHTRMGRKCGTKDCPSLVAYVDQLEAENAELKSRHCQHYHVKEHYCDVHETRIAELLAKVDALEADKRNWQDGYYLAKLTELEAERDELQERVDNLCASEEIGNKLIMVQLETEAEQGRTIVEYAEKVDALEEENRIMRERLRSIADNDVTVFGMKLDEVRNLQVKNAELHEKLSIALGHAHDTVKLIDLGGESE